MIGLGRLGTACFTFNYSKMKFTNPSKHICTDRRLCKDVIPFYKFAP